VNIQDAPVVYFRTSFYNTSKEEFSKQRKQMRNCHIEMMTCRSTVRLSVREHWRHVLPCFLSRASDYLYSP
jgi:hypothetical protein